MQQACFYCFVTSLVAVVISGNVHFIVFARTGIVIPAFQNKTLFIAGVCCKFWRVLFYCGTGGHRKAAGEK